MELLWGPAPAAGFKPALQLAMGSSYQHQLSWLCLFFEEQPCSSSCSLIPKSQRFQLLFDQGQGRDKPSQELDSVRDTAITSLFV